MTMMMTTMMMTMTMMTMMMTMMTSRQANGTRDGDVIDLRDMPGINSFGDIRDVAQNKGGDVVLRFSTDNQLRIEDFKVGQLENNDFLF